MTSLNGKHKPYLIEFSHDTWSFRRSQTNIPLYVLLLVNKDQNVFLKKRLDMSMKNRDLRTGEVFFVHPTCTRNSGNES